MGRRGGKVLFAHLCYFWGGNVLLWVLLVFGEQHWEGCSVGVAAGKCSGVDKGQSSVIPCPVEVIPSSPFLRQGLLCAFPASCSSWGRS